MSLQVPIINTFKKGGGERFLCVYVVGRKVKSAQVAWHDRPLFGNAALGGDPVLSVWLDIPPDTSGTSVPGHPDCFFLVWFGPVPGVGFCLLTDLQWKVKRLLGQCPGSTSFVSYELDRFFYTHLSQRLVDLVVEIGYYFAAVLSLYANFVLR